MTLPEKQKYVEEDIPIVEATLVEPAPPTENPAHVEPPRRRENIEGREPVQITCKFCGKEGITIVKDEWSSATWTFSICCFLFGFWPCACLPCCVKSVCIFLPSYEFYI